MKKVALLSFLYLPFVLLAGSADLTHDFILKKEGLANVEVIEKEDQSKRILSFRWTLFQNERLVLLVKYDGHPMQYILQKRYKRNSIKIALRDDYKDAFKRSYFFLKFSKFDEKKKEALLKVSIHDPEKRSNIVFVDVNSSKG